MKYDEAAARRWVQARLSPERFGHSMAVAARADELARRYGADPDKARFCGIVHDVCKELPRGEQLEMIRLEEGEPEPAVLLLPQLFHAMAAPRAVREELGIEDTDILCAVRYHTTARAGMSLLEEVVYLADLTSADRRYPDAAHVRELADRDIPGAMLYALQYILGCLLKEAKPVCRDSAEAYNDYVLRAQGGIALEK